MRALTRKPEKTKQLFNNHPNLEVKSLCRPCWTADLSLTGVTGCHMSSSLLSWATQVRAVARRLQRSTSKYATLTPLTLYCVCACGMALQVATADLRDASTLPPVVSGVDAVCCCTGTTAFPSDRCAAAFCHCALLGCASL